MFGHFRSEAKIPMSHYKDGETHPWVTQLWRDLEDLQQLDEGKRITDIIDDDFTVLFTQPDLRGEFCSIDVSGLRKRELTNAIAPPGYEALDGVGSPEGAGPQARVYVCQEVRVDRSVCGMTFPGRSALHFHKVNATNARNSQLHLTS